MTITLYAATIPAQIQILGSISRLMDKASSFCTNTGIAPDDLIQSRIIGDMEPLAYQVKSTAVHSCGAIEGVRRGAFEPDVTDPPTTFQALKARVEEAIHFLQNIDPAEVNSFIGRDVIFHFSGKEMPFLAEDFLLSFSQPNFYFHATTAYDILRMNGLDIGKKDFNGRVRTKT